MQQKYFSWIILVALLFCNNAINSAERNILYEEFTNRGGTITNQMRISQDRAVKAFAGQVIAIRYHVYWPDNTDPLFLPLKERGYERIFDYDVRYLPDVRINGRVIMERTPGYRTYHTLKDTLASFLTDEPAVFSLSIWKSLNSASLCTVRVTCVKTGAVAANDLVLHCILVEDVVTVASNIVEDDIARYFITEPEGFPLNFATTDTIVYFREFGLVPEWKKDNLKVIAFIQDPAEKHIFQAQTSRISHRLVCEKPLRQLRQNETAIFHLGVRNSSLDSAVTFVIDDIKKNPSNFDCDINLLYPTEYDTIASYLKPVLRLPGTASDSLQIQVIAGRNMGTVKVEVSVFALNQPEKVLNYPISVSVMDKNTILIVDDDGFKNYESLYEKSIPEDFPFVTWEREWQAPTLEILRAGIGIIWFTGLAYPTLDPYDRMMLAQYLDSGGQLCISGQDIGWELCDSSSIMFDPGGSTVEFYQNYFAAKYLEDESNMSFVYSPMYSERIDSVIVKLDESQLYPSVIAAMEPAEPFLAYNEVSLSDKRAGFIDTLFTSAPKAAVWQDRNAAKIAYVAFGLEGISDTDSRDQLMMNILNRIGIDSSTTLVHYSRPVTPFEFNLAQNYPNPFNSITVIEFNVADPSHVHLEIYDILGRQIATPVDEIKQPGTFKCMFDGANHASGMYFYRIRMGNFCDVKKMILLK